jgi:hypothetical protein
MLSQRPGEWNRLCYSNSIRRGERLLRGMPVSARLDFDITANNGLKHNVVMKHRPKVSFCFPRFCFILTNIYFYLITKIFSMSHRHNNLNHRWTDSTAADDVYDVSC